MGYLRYSDAEVPRHILMSAVKVNMECELCGVEKSLKGLTDDGQEDELRRAMEGFYYEHSGCKAEVTVSLNKSQLLAIKASGKSRVEFTLKAIEAAIKAEANRKPTRKRRQKK